jgi:hypothetical protein
MENRCSSGNRSSTVKELSILGMRDRKSATLFSLPGRSLIVISNSYNNNNHRVTRPLVIGLLARYLIAE